MKVVAVNGSPRAEGNTYHALKHVCDALNADSIDTEIIHVGDKVIRGCSGCRGCSKGECVYSDDDFRAFTGKMYEADGILIGSPVFYAGIAGTLKSFLDRAFFQSGGRMRGKIGAGIAICRRSGGMTTFEQINAYFLISEMVVAPSFYWNVGHGMVPADVLKDDEGLATMEMLGKNMAWLLKMKQEAKIAQPESVKRVMTNFIR